jgi:hypothetical protein
MPSADTDAPNRSDFLSRSCTSKLEVELVETSKNGIQVIKMIGKRSGKNNYVVEVHQTIYLFQPSQDKVHVTLKCCWRIGQPERHLHKFVQTIMTDEGALFSIMTGYSHE